MMRRTLCRSGLRRPATAVTRLNNFNRRSFSDQADQEVESGGLSKRLRITAEVAVSKLFPAGFCWQGASVIAEDAGYKADELGFFLYTGAGDFVGVMGGHVLFYSLAKQIYLPEVNVGNEVQTGLWLGSAAFLSGASWQPIVNFCSESGMSFTPAALTTTAGCGTMFYLGLRLFRKLYGGLGMTAIDSSAGALTDAQLSLAIGGATGAFVGTDLSFSGNWLGGIVGVTDADSIATGMCKAGSSTFLGFSAFQMVQNFVVPAGTNWTD